MSVGIRELQKINVIRANRWHNGDFKEWSPLEWAGCMTGEAGEAANFAKKLKRLESQIKNIDKREEKGVQLVKLYDKYAMEIGREVADTVIYGVLLCERVQIDLNDMIVDVFNKKSEEYNFPERLEY